MGWHVYESPVECRAVPNGGCVIPAGASVYRLASAPRVTRCERHAPVSVDWAAVDAARHALEARREGVAQVNAEQPSFLPRRRSAPFDARLAAAGESQP